MSNQNLNLIGDYGVYRRWYKNLPEAIDGIDPSDELAMTTLRTIFMVERLVLNGVEACAEWRLNGAYFTHAFSTMHLQDINKYPHINVKAYYAFTEKGVEESGLAAVAGIDPKTKISLAVPSADPTVPGGVTVARIKVADLVTKIRNIDHFETYSKKHTGDIEFRMVDILFDTHFANWPTTYDKVKKVVDSINATLSEKWAARYDHNPVLLATDVVKMLATIG